MTLVWSAGGTSASTRVRLGDLIVFTSQAIFQAAMTGEEIGTSGGDWRFDSSGSSASSNTGPGTNNTLEFVHTETSSMGGVANGIANGTASITTVPDGTDRRLRLRVSLQGSFNNGKEGLGIESRASDTDTWEEAGFVYGWAYAATRDQGDTVTDYNSVEQTFVEDGGWIDVEIDIPDGHTQVRVRPLYTDTAFTQDIAWRELEWTGFAPGTDPVSDSAFSSAFSNAFG